MITLPRVLPRRPISQLTSAEEYEMRFPVWHGHYCMMGNQCQGHEKWDKIHPAITYILDWLKGIDFLVALFFLLTHWALVMHTWTSVNSSLPGTAYMHQWTGSALIQVMAWRLFWRQAITWTNADLLSIGPFGANFNETLIEIQNFSLKKINFKMLPVKQWPFCPGGDELIGPSVHKVDCCP